MSLFLDLRKHGKLAEKRNPMYEKSKFGKFWMYFMFVFWAGYLIFFGTTFAFAFDGGATEAYHVMNSGLIFVLVLDFLIRLPFQKTPTQEVKPYLLLPIKRNRLIDFLLIRSGLDGFNLFWLFTIGCVFGLVIETIYHFVLFGEYQDRAGFLWGPFSPIYGFGVVIVTVLLNHLWQSNWLLIFCSSAVIGGAFEYFTSWFMQAAFGIRAWDYTGQWLSIDGRTSGKYMFFWGILGLIWVKLILPRLLRLIQRIPWKIRYSLTLVCFIFLFVDGVMTLMALDAWYSRMAGVAQNSPVSQFFATYFNDDFMAHRFQTMKIDPSTAGRM